MFDFMCGCVVLVLFFFIGVLNEFGEFESGVIVCFFGLVGVVVFGGVVFFFVIGFWVKWFLDLCKFDCF